MGLRRLITVVAVNWNAPEFARLLVESWKRYSQISELLLIENSDVPTSLPGVLVNPGEKSHGCGLNLGISRVSTEFVLLLDVDCHFLGPWEGSFLERLGGAHILTVAGSESKPIRVACVFMRTEDARRYDWRATPGYRGHRITPDGFDVGIQAYRRMVTDGMEIRFLESTGSGRSRYHTANGEEYGGLIYHHWHGSCVHLACRQADFPGVDLVADRDKLFRSIPWRKVL